MEAQPHYRLQMVIVNLVLRGTPLLPRPTRSRRLISLVRSLKKSLWIWRSCFMSKFERMQQNDTIFTLWECQFNQLNIGLNDVLENILIRQKIGGTKPQHKRSLFFYQPKQMIIRIQCFSTVSFISLFPFQSWRWEIFSSWISRWLNTCCSLIPKPYTFVQARNIQKTLHWKRAWESATRWILALQHIFGRNPRNDRLSTH